MTDEIIKAARYRAKNQAERLKIFLSGLKSDIEAASIQTPEMHKHILLKVDAILVTLNDLHKNLDYQIQYEQELEDKDFVEDEIG